MFDKLITFIADKAKNKIIASGQKAHFENVQKAITQGSKEDSKEGSDVWVFVQEPMTIRVERSPATDPTQTETETVTVTENGRAIQKSTLHREQGTGKVVSFEVQSAYSRGGFSFRIPRHDLA